jgi:hypothetical protein
LSTHATELCVASPGGAQVQHVGEAGRGERDELRAAAGRAARRGPTEREPRGGGEHGGGGLLAQQPGASDFQSRGYNSTGISIRSLKFNRDSILSIWWREGGPSDTALMLAAAFIRNIGRHLKISCAPSSNPFWYGLWPIINILTNAPWRINPGDPRGLVRPHPGLRVRRRAVGVRGRYPPPSTSLHLFKSVSSVWMEGSRASPPQRPREYGLTTLQTL